MNQPKPALVTQRGARRLPRLPLLLLCAAYLLPGLVGRDPWRNADLTAFGQMMAMVEGRSSWWTPVLGQVPTDSALLPHWLGALFIQLGQGWLDPALAARLPFTALLALTLALVWYTTLHLARTESAQPVPFAFGGEAEPIDYARAIADGAVLALMASLGLLVLGHETTPELAQLFAVSLYLYGLAAAPYRQGASRAATLFALPLLAGFGAPSMAVAMGAVGVVVCALSRYAQVRSLTVWLAVAVAAAGGLAQALGAWHWRAVALHAADVADIARQWLWFLWPTWPLVLLALWRWRRQWAHRHLAVPLGTVLVALVANVGMGGSDRALMLGLPGMAVLAAFALPTLKRSAAAAIDWFSMCFFTAFALWIWFVYLSLQTGWPAWQAHNIRRLLPEFQSSFSLLALVLAGLSTAAWVAVVRWRTGRHREALWKSLVLPAGGVGLCWMLAMTLWLQPLDYARSPRPLMQRLTAVLPADTCVWTPGLAPAGVAAMEVFGPWRVDARAGDPGADCGFLLRATRERQPPAVPVGWTVLGKVNRPTDRDETTWIYRRLTPTP